MARKTSSYRESLLASLTDPSEAAEYLNAALEDFWAIAELIA